MWLDDVRPAPEGWVHVTSVEEAKRWLLSGRVEKASLDHDLGACDNCIRTDFRCAAKLGCPHVPNGYDLVCWMHDNNVWPRKRPSVHSANPIGKQKMLDLILRRNWLPIPIAGSSASLEWSTMGNSSLLSICSSQSCHASRCDSLEPRNMLLAHGSQRGSLSLGKLAIRRRLTMGFRSRADDRLSKRVCLSIGSPKDCMFLM